MKLIPLIFEFIKKSFRILRWLIIPFIIILVIPQNLILPVEGATHQDYNKDTFWYYPWGKSITHKGIDIFANEGKGVLSACTGLVVHTGNKNRGGNTVAVLGPKWRLHYYAHLKEHQVQVGHWASRGERLGTVGTTGNAAGKPPHLHYAIISLVPIPWKADDAVQGWMKMFFLNPIEELKK